MVPPSSPTRPLANKAGCLENIAGSIYAVMKDVQMVLSKHVQESKEVFARVKEQEETMQQRRRGCTELSLCGGACLVFASCSNSCTERCTRDAQKGEERIKHAGKNSDIGHAML